MPSASGCERSLKTLGSATSYGIFAQMDRQESDKEVELTCYGIDPEPYACKVKHPEAPGEYCFPPLASLITSGGHLLLALLERLVTDRGGTYAMEDTDSMAIVATRARRPSSVPGRTYRMDDGREAIRALSWEQVAEIVELFAQLNPYDRAAVPGLDPQDRRRQLRSEDQRAAAAVVSGDFRQALRALPARSQRRAGAAAQGHQYPRQRGRLVAARPRPSAQSDRSNERRSQLDRAGMAGHRAPIARPCDGAAAVRRSRRLGQITVSSPEVLRPLAKLNAGKPYAQQIKPFNFILSCHVAPFGHPADADPERFHLIAPYETDPRKWLALPWIDQYSGKQYRISTTLATGTRQIARVKSYGDVLEEYEFHPEAKCADANGAPCDKQTVGLLQRRHVTIEWPSHFIGKESNKLEEVEEGSVCRCRRRVYRVSGSATRRVGDQVLPKLNGCPDAGIYGREPDSPKEGCK